MRKREGTLRRFGVQGLVIALLLILTTNCCIPFNLTALRMHTAITAAA